MKQIFKTSLGLRTEEVPVPTPGPNEILVRVCYSLISTGTETGSMQKKSQQSLSERLEEKSGLLKKVIEKIQKEGFKPTVDKIRKKVSPAEADIIFRPIGYSNAGVVLEKGRLVTHFNIGDKVACAGSGIAAHAEYTCIPVNLAVKVPDDLSLDKATFTTVASIALHGLRRSECRPGETIVIVGLGLLGMIAVQIAKAYGYRVIGIDLIESRIKLAKTLGADFVFNGKQDLQDTIYRLTDRQGADAVAIYASAGSSDIVNNAMKWTRRKGRVCVIGNVGMDVQREEMYKKEIDLIMSTSYGPGRYDDTYEIEGVDYPYGYVRWTENRNMMEIVRLLYENKLNVIPLVNQVFNVDEADAAFKSLIDKEKDYISVLFKYADEKAEISSEPVSKIQSIQNNIPSSDIINVGIIGAGGFARRTHMPNLTKLNNLYQIAAVADKDPVNARQAGKLFKAGYVTTDYHDLLRDDKIDMVIITTRHHLHAEMAVEALRHNKHVLVEKPLAITKTELQQVIDTAGKSKGILRVGFNRRYSPLIQKAKQVIDREKTPLFIQYRINAGYMAPDHWTQDYAVGGGRILGEFCHFIDLTNYLNRSALADMQVSFIPVDQVHIFSEDNVCVNLRYEDGSMAQISYVSIGSNELSKERIEIMLNKKAMLIDDFEELKMYQTGMPDIRLEKSDKGHLNELEVFSKLIRGVPSYSPPFEMDVESTELSFKILEAFGHC